MTGNSNNVTGANNSSILHTGAPESGKRLILSIEKKGNGKVDIHMNMWVAKKLAKTKSIKTNFDIVVEMVKTDSELCGVRFYHDTLCCVSSMYLFDELEYPEDILMPYGQANKYSQTLFNSVRTIRRLL